MRVSERRCSRYPRGKKRENETEKKKRDRNVPSNLRSSPNTMQRIIDAVRYCGAQDRKGLSIAFEVSRMCRGSLSFVGGIQCVFVISTICFRMTRHMSLSSDTIPCSIEINCVGTSRTQINVEHVYNSTNATGLFIREIGRF